MHELALLSIPALVAPYYAGRAWFAKRRARKMGAIELGQRLGRWGPLPTAGGPTLSSADTKAARLTVYVFMSNRCPGVKAYDDRLQRLHQHYCHHGVQFVGVNSIPDNLYPTEAQPYMASAAKDRGIPFAYAKDAKQELKRRLGAVCTPQAFVVDSSGRLRYRGRIDDEFIEARAESHDLRNAIEEVLRGIRVSKPETRAIGCSIDEVHGGQPVALRKPSRVRTPA